MVASLNALEPPPSRGSILSTQELCSASVGFDRMCIPRPTDEVGLGPKHTVQHT